MGQAGYRWRHGRLTALIAAGLWSAVAMGAEPAVAFLAYSDGYWQAWVMAPDGGAQRQVTRTAYDKSRVSWFPGGTGLLVNGNQGEVVRVDIETGQETPVPMPIQGTGDAVLSPDGKRIAFSVSTAESRDNNNLWVVGIDGKALTKLTSMPWLQHQPAWSPDGQALYFVSGRGRQTHDIWRYGFPDGRLEQLTSGQLYHFDVTVSPKGELAYSSNRSGNYEIWVQGGGEEPARLTHHPALDAGPTWSPDGSTLLFESSRGGVPNIWKMTPGGSPPVQVTRHEGGARAPVWRHDAGGGR